MGNPEFSIANKLEVLPGNIMLLPGCEPTSEMTSANLSVNMYCPKTHIRLATALTAIPAATIIIISNCGDGVTRKYFVLPDGPPPGMGDCCRGSGDWYAILRAAAFADEPVESGPMECQSDGFGYNAVACNA
jgi:hypothetical protein